MENVIVNGIDITNYVTSFEQYDEMEDDKLIGNAVSTQIKVILKDKDNQLKDLLDYPFIIGNKTYIVYDKPKKWTSTISVTLYDKMILTNVAFSTGLEYPVILSDQIDEMAIISGVRIDKTTLSDELLQKEVNWYDNTMIIRNYIGFIAQCDGKNATIEDDKIVFKPLAEDTHQTDFCSNYELNELITFSRVCFENGVTSPLECGDDTGKTLYLSSNNLYVEQSDIDRIYGMYNGLSFYSFKKFNCRDIDGIGLTHIINYNDITILPLSIKRKVYGGKAKDSLEMSGNITLKNADSIIVRDDPMIRLKRVQATVDQIDQKVTIVAEHQEGTDTKIAEFELSLNGVETLVERSSENIYRFETGNGNLFDNCHQLITKDSSVTEKVQSINMSLGINKDYMTGKDICISVDIYVKNGIIGSLDGYCGAEFDVGYSDGTVKTYAIRFYVGQLTFQYTLNSGVLDFDKRIYAHYKLEDKEITSVSNLRIVANMNAEKIIISNPKVEFGTYPTGFSFDNEYVRDSIVTLNRDYTQIVQNVSELSLKSISLTEEITTIKGDVSNVQTRLQSTEIKLQPTNILMAVNEKIGADGQLYTTKFILDKDGAHINGGGLDISNNAGTKVLYADGNGNLVINNLTAQNGTFTGTVSGSTVTGSNITGSTITGSSVIATGSDAYGRGKGVTIKNGTMYSYANNSNGNVEYYGEFNGGYISMSRRDSSQHINNLSNSSIEIVYSISIHSEDALCFESMDRSGDYGVGTYIFDGYVSSPHMLAEAMSNPSDIRLKHNIKDIDVSWIDKLNIKTYDYINGTKNMIGIIANEYLNEECSKYFLGKDHRGYYSVNYGNITNALIKYCQNLKNDLNNATKEIAYLKARIGG